jgi:hypothetical protein
VAVLSLLFVFEAQAFRMLIVEALHSVPGT